MAERLSPALTVPPPAAARVRAADVLILGGGFAGFSCFRNVDRRRRRAHLVTNRDHFLFTPLLPLVATGAVEARSIIEPIRSFEKELGEIIIADAVDFDPSKKTVTARFQSAQAEEIRYETLVVAVGARIATYGIPGVAEHCLFLKEIKDARALREKVLFQFERALHLEGRERQAALTFVAVGGGPTGVEVVCDIEDLVRNDLRRNFPELRPLVRLAIVEAGKDILPVFDQALVRYAQKKLRQKGIAVRTGAAVSRVEKGRVVLSDGDALDAETILWAAGNGAQDFTRKVADRFGVRLDRFGRLPVDRSLRVVGGFGDVYAIGDCSEARDDRGLSLPATGQVAQVQGEFLGRRLCDHSARSFQFRVMGMLASLGTGAAIADLGRLHFKGALAWWFWKAVYLTKLVSARNKFSVAIDWIKVRFFGRNTARIDF